MIIGVTGVFGSGKTTIAKLLVKHGYKHINADEIGHEILNKKEIKDRIIKKFGKGILTKNKIDRRKLKDIVFYDNKRLSELNRIIHPEIIKEIESIIKKIKDKDIVIDAPLLIEAKALHLVDKLIVVKIAKEEHLKRISKKYNKKEVRNIMRCQLSQKEKLKYADIIIDNSRNLKNTEKQVKTTIFH